MAASSTSTDPINTKHLSPARRPSQMYLPPHPARLPQYHPPLGTTVEAVLWPGAQALYQSSAPSLCLSLLCRHGTLPLRGYCACPSTPARNSTVLQSKCLAYCAGTVHNRFLASVPWPCAPALYFTASQSKCHGPVCRHSTLPLRSQSALALCADTLLYCFAVKVPWPCVPALYSTSL